MPNPRVLAVDDEPINLEILERRLASEGFDVLLAENGTRGLALAKAEHPDLILLDVMMPEQNGYDVCHALKNDPDTRGIPVIFVTARSDTYDKAKGFALGAVDYIAKPFHPAEVLHRVRAALEARHVKDHLTASQARSDWYRRALNAATALVQEGVVLHDEKGAVILWNAAMELLTGRTIAEVAGLPCLEALALEAHGGGPYPCDAAPPGGDDLWSDAILVSKDGRRIPVSFRRMLVPAASPDRPAGAVIVFRIPGTR